MIAPIPRAVCQDVRTLFVSDVHLGSRHSQCEPFLQMLKQYRPRSLYLVGDILDGWRWPDAWVWKESCLSLLRVLEELAEQGTDIYYTPGNHDEFLRNPAAVATAKKYMPFIEIADEFIFTAADGRRLLVTHGDHFDLVERSAQWLSKMSSWMYDTALSSNWCLSRMLRKTDRSPYWLCASGKRRVKSLIRFLSSFEAQILQHARKKGCQGVVCGHLHTPAMIERDGMTYFNTGDWVENCTSLVETEEGEFDIDCFYPWTSMHGVIRRRSGSQPPLLSKHPVLAPACSRPVNLDHELIEVPVLPH